MAQLIDIEDARDPRLSDYRDLRESTLRHLLETEQGLFIAEGEKVVRRALRAGHRARSFLMAERWVDGLRDELDASEAPCYVVSERLAEEITGFHVHRGALASLHRLPLPTLDDVLNGAERVLVLEDVVDHANVGSMFRNAAAFGFDAIVVSPRCADPLYRRAVKVAMGTTFAIPWTRLPSWRDAMEQLHMRGFATIALTLAEDAQPLDDVLDRVTGPVALILGSEGPGLSVEWERGAQHRAIIGISAEVDSLNVAAACAVACYEVARRR